MQALLQSASMGSAEMTVIGEAGVGVFTNWVYFALTEEARCFPFFRKTGTGSYQAMSAEYFERRGCGQRYLRLRRNETDPTAGSEFLPVKLIHKTSAI